MQQAEENSTAAAVQSRKRPRAARACERCRTKKYRCDEMDTCGRCLKARVVCVYSDAESFRWRVTANTQPYPRDSLVEQSDSQAILSKPQAETEVVQQQSSSIAHTHAALDGEESDGEIYEINPHTQNREFHGATSSLAFLAALQRPGINDLGHPPQLGTQALVSAFHNDSFSPQSIPSAEGDSFSSTRYFFRRSRNFLDGYFKNLHFIHPIIDQDHFLSRCEDLWFGRQEKQPRSFVALYFAIMSLGALTHEWTEETLDGQDRWQWSRKLFELASLFMGGIPVKVDIETVHASIMMAKVCQNELNPHLAYMYLGMAVRTSLSAGHNRQPRGGPRDTAISRTWWGLYSLEMETSFALGRTDSLGPDMYHNRALPQVETSETGILTPMVQFARLIRRISASVHVPAPSVEQRIQLAAEIETDLNAWVAALPEAIKPQLGESNERIGLAKDPAWAKKQRHTLRFRYYNAIMVLTRPFLLYARRTKGSSNAEGVYKAVSRCVTSAGSTIRLMHHLYSSAPYFRTWYYNTTYTLYAASIILGYHITLAAPQDRPELLELLSLSIDVLRVMDDHGVAKKAADLLQGAFEKICNDNNGRVEDDDCLLTNEPAPDDLSTQDTFFDFLNDEGFDFAAHLFPLDGERLFAEDPC